MEGDFKKGVEQAEKLLNGDLCSAYKSLVYFKLAKGNLKLSQWNQAQDYLNKIVQQFPQSMECGLAKQLLEEKHYFGVQVGEFSDRSSAQKLVNELKEKQEYVYIIESFDQLKQKLYKVRVGQLSLLEEAVKLSSKLSRQGYSTQIYP